MTTRTFAPYPMKMARQMKIRAYDVDVIYPDGSFKQFESMGHFAQATGHILPHVRANAVYWEMQIGDQVKTEWTDKAGGTYRFTFTRRK